MADKSWESQRLLMKALNEIHFFYICMETVVHLMLKTFVCIFVHLEGTKENFGNAEVVKMS